MSSLHGDRFTKSMRLRKRGEFLHVQQHGRKVQSRAFIGLLLDRGDGAPRLGITTTKRLGGAVTRNRIRRLVREAFRCGRLGLPSGMDVVVIARPASLALDTRALWEDLADLGRRAASLADRKQ